jgi:hypothetical protein
MIKKQLKEMPVITIHIEPGDKEALTLEAEKRGMQLATYCRMLLLESLNSGGK